jgi:ATP-dependent DNA helicase PIF1
MELSSGQKKVLGHFNDNENIFVTGPGGSGKSEVIKHIFNKSTEKSIKICVTALTGVAANLLDCNATTLHSWAGIGLGTRDLNSNIRKIRKSKFKLDNWVNTDVLVIDEVSMLSLELFEMLDKIGKNIRNNDKIFGGIQVILSGDFFQLPPIGNDSFCFESDLFNFFKKVCLRVIFRQDNPEFKKILNNIRVGKITMSGIGLLKSRIGLTPPDNIEPTFLSPIKRIVTDINNKKLGMLDGEEYTFNKILHSNLELTKTGQRKRNLLTSLEIDQEINFIGNSTLCEEKMTLKIGAHVMYIVNSDDLYNGCQGIVNSFVNEYPLVHFYSGIKRVIMPYMWKSDTIPGVGIEQIPLILSWAVTIHKSQGCTLDYAKVNIGKDIFEAGQSYVALSRLKNIDGLFIEHFCPEKIIVNKKVIDFYSKL